MNATYNFLLFAQILLFILYWYKIPEAVHIAHLFDYASSAVFGNCLAGSLPSNNGIDKEGHQERLCKVVSKTRVDSKSTSPCSQKQNSRSPRTSLFSDSLVQINENRNPNVCFNASNLRLYTTTWSFCLKFQAWKQNWGRMLYRLQDNFFIMFFIN